jgi:hypothetical protein
MYARPRCTWDLHCLFPAGSISGTVYLFSCLRVLVSYISLGLVLSLDLLWISIRFD